MTEILSETETIRITHSSNGKKLRFPIVATVPRAKRPAQKALNNYIIDAFSKKMPSLIPFSFNNKTILERAKYLLRHKTGSHATLYQDVYGMYRFCESIDTTPDLLVKRCKNSDGYQDQQETQRLIRQIDDFIGDLQAEGLAKSTINNYVKGVKALFRNNGLSLTLPFKMSKRVQYKDRSPTPEELQQVIEIADIREKVIVSILALSGMRIGTLVKLQYRHVMSDLERGTVPVHLHIESSIVKGEYADYDTFLSAEAVNYLKVYLDTRRRGTRKIPPETITPESPLIRNKRKNSIEPISESQVHRVVNALYKKTGMIRQSTAKRYEVRPHSLRKYFKTQMTKLGTINSDYIEYMMGHVTDTYNDIESVGIEYLRELYRNSGLSIRPKTKLDKIETLKAIAETLGLNPDEVLSREAMVKPHRTIIDPAQKMESDFNILSRNIRKTLMDELKTSRYLSLERGSPEEIRTPVRGSRGPYP